jgi:outer membrane protein TolC
VTGAEAALISARWALLPGGSFTAQGGVPGNFSAKLDASWQADIFGSLRNSKRKAQAAVEQSKAYQQAVQTQLVATIANSYYTLLMLDEKLSISKRTMQTWEENIRTLEALKRAGKTNEAAVLQAKANKLNVEASILTLEKEILAMENSFCALVSVVPMPIERSSLKDLEFPESLSVGVPAELLSRRPDVRQAELALAQTVYSVNSAKAAFYPALTLSGSLGWTTQNGNIVPELNTRHDLRSHQEGTARPKDHGDQNQHEFVDQSVLLRCNKCQEQEHIRNQCDDRDEGIATGHKRPPPLN